MAEGLRGHDRGAPPPEREVFRAVAVGIGRLPLVEIVHELRDELRVAGEDLVEILSKLGLQLATTSRADRVDDCAQRFERRRDHRLVLSPLLHLEFVIHRSSSGIDQILKLREVGARTNDGARASSLELNGMDDALVDLHALHTCTPAVVGQTNRAFHFTLAAVRTAASPTMILRSLCVAMQVGIAILQFPRERCDVRSIT